MVSMVHTMVQRGYIVYSVQQGTTVVQCVVEEWYDVWEGYMCESVSCQSVKTEFCSCFILLSFDLFLYIPLYTSLCVSMCEVVPRTCDSPPRTNASQRVPFPRTPPPRGRSAGW